MAASRREREYDNWKRAVERTYGWLRTEDEDGD